MHFNADISEFFVDMETEKEIKKPRAVGAVLFLAANASVNAEQCFRATRC
jgi:hypothetical protein